MSSGWWRVTGEDWGLRSDPYLANVLSYSCHVSASPTSTPKPTPTSVQPGVVTVTPNPTATPTVAQSSANFGPAVGGPSGDSSPSVCTASEPETPMALAINKVGTDSVKLEWTKIDSATHYVIEYGQDPDNYIYGVPNTGNQTSYEIGKLDLTKRYYFRVRAVADCMPGDPSNVISYPQAMGQVLGLASTSSFDWTLATLGLFAIGAGVWAIKMRY